MIGRMENDQRSRSSPFSSFLSCGIPIFQAETDFFNPERAGRAYVSLCGNTPIRDQHAPSRMSSEIFRQRFVGVGPEFRWAKLLEIPELCVNGVQTGSAEQNTSRCQEQGSVTAES